MKRYPENIAFYFGFISLIIFLCAVHWISHHVPKRQKKIARVSPRPLGPTKKQDWPPVGNIFFLPVLVCFFSRFFSTFSIKISKSKIQNQTSKITPPKKWNGTQKTLFFYFGFISLIIFLCAVHWISHHVPKRPKKKSREFPLGP